MAFTGKLTAIGSALALSFVVFGFSSFVMTGELLEKIVQVEHPSGGVLDVDETVIDSLKGRMLVWIWYSSDEVSTGSFFHFRRMYAESGHWHTYQVATSASVGEEGLAAVLTARGIAEAGWVW